jgi:2-keto-4-pentenoate hydratase
LLHASDVSIASMNQAYEIQDHLTARRLARGARIVGWKLGYTSAAMREQMGVSQPNFGPLFDYMMLDHDVSITNGVAQPKVEPEIALCFAAPVEAGADREAVLAAVGSANACLEVVDSVWSDYRFTIEHNTADGSSASYVCIGDPLAYVGSLADVKLELRRNSITVANAVGAAASGHPADGVVWLAAELGKQGRRIESGHIVITGGLCAAVDLLKGDVVEASFDETTTVRVHRSSKLDF